MDETSPKPDSQSEPVHHRIDFLPSSAKLSEDGRVERRRYQDQSKTAVTLIDNLNQRIAELERQAEQESQAKAELQRKAYHDSLTGLPNRRYFDEFLPQIMDTAREQKLPLALVIADADKFKLINDTLGHPVGDKVVIAEGNAFRSALRPTDVSGRLGGDEFYGILLGFSHTPEQTEGELIATTESRIQADYVKNCRKDGIPESIDVGLSVAIVMMEPGDNPETLYRRADELLKERKDAVHGRAPVQE